MVQLQLYERVSVVSPTAGKYFRRVYASPDKSMVALTDEARTVHVIPQALLLQSSPEALQAHLFAGDNSAHIQCAEPPRCVSWCPFMKGGANACLVTCCQSSPVQLFDAASGDMRASYCIFNSFDEPESPFCATWGGTAHTDIVAGCANATTVVFDVTRARP